MSLSKYFPTPSDRMGFLWSLASIEDVFVIEFGPAGTTHFALEGIMELNADHRMNVFTTHMSEVDITFGKHDKLVGAIKEVDLKHSPKYIFVLASSVSSLIGVDIESICIELEHNIKAKLIPIPYGGYDGDYNLGVERALLSLTKNIVKDTKKVSGLYNIIGCDIDSYNFLSDKAEIELMLQNIFNLKLNTCFTANSSVEEIENAAKAEYNIVLRAEGLKAAEQMKKDFGIPYAYKKPYGINQTMQWIKEIAESFSLNINMQYVTSQSNEVKQYLRQYKSYLRGKSCKDVIVCAEYDTCIGVASLLEDLGLNCNVKLVKHTALSGFIGQENIIYKPQETELSEYLNSDYYAVFGDDNLRKLCNNKSFFQIANPCMDKYNFYKGTPLLGFNGTLLALQTLMNFERAKSKL